MSSVDAENQRQTMPDLQRPRAPALFLLAALLSCSLPALAQRARLTHAPEPAKLIRKTQVYQAPAGVALYPGDLVDAGTQGVQIEWPSGVMLALGPGSAVVVDDALAFPAVTLVHGWLKVAGASNAANARLNVAAGSLSIGAAGAGVIHVAPGKTELFVEQGSLQVSAVDRTPAAAPLVLGRDQYALQRAPEGLQTSPRPARPFVNEMPRAFFDPLVALAARTRPAEPAPQREATPADLAPYADAAAPLRRQLANRLAPRPPVPPRKPPRALSNTLF